MPSEEESVRFRKIEQPKSKAAYVAEQIIDVIKNGSYKVGDRLPAERVIATQMRVSRNSVREALSALQILGIIESRPGDGTYIRVATVGNLKLGSAVHLARAAEDLFEIWEARKEIEISIVRLAISRATEDALARVGVILERMQETAHVGDNEGFLAANTEFHLSIADAADNLPLRNALAALMEITTQRLLEEINLGYVIESIEKSFEEHRNIFDAVVNRDEEAAIRAVEVHYEELGKYFGRRYRPPKEVI